jgi:KDO2-lipid IV(A) lauroyltransferase
VSGGACPYLWKGDFSGADMARGETGERGPGRYLADLAIRAVIGALRLLPYPRRVPAMGWLTSRVLAPLLGWNRRVRANLAHVFPDLPEAEVRRLIRAVPDNAGRAVIEVYSAREFAARVEAIELPDSPGLAAVRAAREAGRPVIFVTGHFGNYDVPRAWMRSRGFDVGALYNPMRNAYFNAHYVEALTGFGGPAFPRGRAGLGEMVRFLKQGGMIGMVIDQYMSHGEMLDFLGKPAPTALSAAELALKYGAVLIPIYGIRQPNGLDFAIRIEPPIDGEDPVAVTQALNDSLAAMVRAHMGQWFWIHRRWTPERHAELAG